MLRVEARQSKMTTDSYCFCDLTPLYALDILSDEERQWVEQQVADCPELAEELDDYVVATANLAYSVAPMPMADDLKSRLGDRLGLDLSEPLADLPAEPPAEPLWPDFLTVRAQDLVWQPHDVPGVKMALLHVDPVKRELVGVLRAEAGVRYPMHRHAAVEELYMLAGDLIVDNAVYGVGDYIRSQPGTAHGPHTIGGCMFFFRTSMDDEYF